VTEAEKRRHAERLISEHNDSYDFGLVYEDDELCELSWDEQREIHELMYKAKLEVSWDD
jgi:hypothetical protein